MSRGPTIAYRGEFSGWNYPSARPLGHVNWTPGGGDVELVEAILGVFNRYRAQGLLPLGPRGVGYRLEGDRVGGRLVIKGDDKVPAAEHRRIHGGPVFTFRDISEVLTLLCRSERLSWDDVDDGRTVNSSPFVAVDLVSELNRLADECEPDLIADQDTGVEFWCEAAGGLGLWSTIAGRWGVPVYSGSGVVPAQAGRAAAIRWDNDVERHRRMLAVIVTDCDPAGYVIADRVAAASRQFLADYGSNVEVDWVRLALSPEQVPQYSIRWGGPKTSAGRTMQQTAEAEALPPENARDLFDALMEEALSTTVLEATRARWAPQVQRAHQLLEGNDE